MNCTGQPLSNTTAQYIEFWNLYCQYNTAWIEVYLNMYKWWMPLMNKGE
jgi:hypothetical protein